MRLAYINGQHYIPISTDKKYECRANIWKQPILTSNTSALPKFAVNVFYSGGYPQEMVQGAFTPFSKDGGPGIFIDVSLISAFIILSFDKPITFRSLTLTTDGHQFSLGSSYNLGAVYIRGFDTFNASTAEESFKLYNSTQPIAVGQFKPLTEDGKQCKALLSQQSKCFNIYMLNIEGSDGIEYQSIDRFIIDAEEF